MKHNVKNQRLTSFIITTFLLTFIVSFFAGCSGKQNQPGKTQSNTTTETAMQSTDTTTPTVVTTTSTPNEISLVMVGDILLHDRVEESAMQPDGTYDFAAIFSQTKEKIQEADLALVNQEVIIGGADLGVSGYPAFNAPFEAGHGLVEAGFDVVCHGTNHALDKGKKGLLSCINFWETNYPQIAVLGIHDSEEDRDALYFYEQDGMKIAILNYTYGTNGISLPSGMPYAVDMLEESQVIADIRRAEAEADFTIVCPHWGTEYQLTPSSAQEKWTRIFLEQGVDLVLGTHPHVIEPVEWVTDEETGHKMLVYYSLGNYVNWTSGTGAGVSNRMVGGMAQVTLGFENRGAGNGDSQSGQESSVVIKDFGIEALVCHVQEGANGVQVYSLSDYTPQLAADNAIVSQAPDFSYEYCVNLCNQVWGDLWK